MKPPLYQETYTLSQFNTNPPKNEATMTLNDQASHAPCMTEYKLQRSLYT